MRWLPQKRKKEEVEAEQETHPYDTLCTALRGIPRDYDQLVQAINTVEMQKRDDLAERMLQIHRNGYCFLGGVVDNILGYMQKDNLTIDKAVIRVEHQFITHYH